MENPIFSFAVLIFLDFMMMKKEKAKAGLLRKRELSDVN